MLALETENNKKKIIHFSKVFSNWNNNSMCNNLLVTDEDIADYSDLISLNYETFFSYSNLGNPNSKPPIQYENIDFDFETEEFCNADAEVNGSNYNNSNSLHHDENANSGLKFNLEYFL